MGLYWADGTVTGSVNVEEDEAIQKLLKGVGKRKLAGVSWPIETAAQLAAELEGSVDDGEPDPPKAVKASSAKADTKGDETAAAMSKVDLPAALDKSTKKAST